MTEKQSRLLELSSMPYEAYLQTPEWQERRRCALAYANNACQVCNSTDGLNVHHRTYERRGVELASDLTVLCRACHEKFHQDDAVATQFLPGRLVFVEDMPTFYRCYKSFDTHLFFAGISIDHHIMLSLCYMATSLFYDIAFVGRNEDFIIDKSMQFKDYTRIIISETAEYDPDKQRGYQEFLYLVNKAGEVHAY